MSELSVEVSPRVTTLEVGGNAVRVDSALTIGSVTLGANPTDYSASITGVVPDRKLNLKLPPGPTGATGPANTLTIGTVTTGSPGSAASSTITGTAPNQTLNLTIPRGDVGASNTLTIGTVTTGAAGSSASATVTGTAPNQTLNLTIPRGDVGAPNTLAIGTVTTGAPGSSASATITGTAPNQTLSLTIPRGDVGAANTLTIGTVSTVAVGGSATASITGTAPNQTLNLGLPTGATGAPPNLAIGTVTTGAPGSSASATLTGTTPNYTLNLTIPRGDAGTGNVSTVNSVAPTSGNVNVTFLRRIAFVQHTNGVSSTRWGRIATITIPTINSEMHHHFRAVSSVSSIERFLEFSTFIRTNSPLNAGTNRFIRIWEAQGLGIANLRLVHTQVSDGTTPHIFEIWLNNNDAWAQYEIYLIGSSVNGGTASYDTNSVPQDNLPAGTAITPVWASTPDLSLSANVVLLDTAQTFAAVKTFSTAPVLNAGHEALAATTVRPINYASGQAVDGVRVTSKTNGPAFPWEARFGLGSDGGGVPRAAVRLIVRNTSTNAVETDVEALRFDLGSGAASFTNNVSINQAGGAARFALTHNANVADGLYLAQTFATGDSPRILFGANNNAIHWSMRLGTADALIFASAATPGTTSGTQRVVFNNAGDVAAATFTGNGAALTNLAAANLTGTIATARLGSGTASATTVLFGDQTYKTLDKAAVGLGNVTNVAQEPAITAGTTAQFWRGDKTWQTLTLADVPDAWVKRAVRAASTANVTIPPGGTSLVIDTITLANGDRVLLKNQTTSSQNGIYTVGGVGTSVTLTRTTDADAISEIAGGTVSIDQGSQGGQLWSTTIKSTDTLGTTNMAWYRVVDTSMADVSGGYQGFIAAGTTAQYWRGDKTWQTLDKNAVGLSNINNVAQVEIAGAQTVTGVKTFSTKTAAVTDSTLLVGDNVAMSTGTGRARLQIGSTNSVSELLLGQSATNGLLFAWGYNATATSAYGLLETYGNNNPLVITSGAGKILMGVIGTPQAKLGNTVSNPVQQTAQRGISNADGLLWRVPSGAGFVGSFFNAGTTAQSDGLFVGTASTDAGAVVLGVDSGSTNRFRVMADGTVNVTGTLNVNGVAVGAGARQVVKYSGSWPASRPAGVTYIEFLSNNVTPPAWATADDTWTNTGL